MQHKSLITLFAMVSICASAQAEYTIYPTPRKATYDGNNITLAQPVRIIAAENVGETTLNRVKQIFDDASISYLVSNTPADGATELYLGSYSAPGEASGFISGKYNSSLFPSATNHYDPHYLAIEKDNDTGRIVILGDDNGSEFYGCASLEQILEQCSLPDVATVRIEDYAHAQYRGIMEGFYGHPYSVESRLNLLEYCRRYKLNYYGYGPKADPYHAGNWREPYPETITEAEANLGKISASDMQRTAEKARECGVAFTWIIHPTLGTGYINLGWTSDIMTKFERMYDLGIRHFGLSVDDMSGHPSNQGDLARDVQSAIDLKWNTADTPASDRVGGILFTPTVYALNYSGSGYVLPTFKNLDSKIDVAFTGYDCFSNVRAASFGTMADYIGRDPVFWWNNPVNDDYDEFLYMHGLTKRWHIENEGAINHMKGFLLNPMNQGQASKVCIFQGAQYSWNPEVFNDEGTHYAALQSMVSSEEYAVALSKFVGILSAYTTRDTRRPEGEALSEIYSNFRTAYPGEDYVGNDQLTETMSEALEACLILESMEDSYNDNDRLLYTDIKPWLDKTIDMLEIMCHATGVTNASVESKERWYLPLNLKTKAADLHKNHQFSVLEGAGNGTYETFKEPQPTPVHLDATIDFLADKIDPELQEITGRNRDILLISNKQDIDAALELDSTLVKVEFNDVVAPTEYIGVNFNRLFPIDLTSAINNATATELALEYSVNGKDWLVPQPDSTIYMAYVRYYNYAEDDVDFPATGLCIDYLQPGEPGEMNLSVSSNMGTYDSYRLENILDGDPTTFYWSNAAPQAGVNEITVDLGCECSVSKVEMDFNASDQPSGEVNIMTSCDGENWQLATSFNKSQIISKHATILFAPTRTRFIQLFFKTVTTAEWLQLCEFSTDATPVPLVGRPQPEGVDNLGREIASLDDSSLKTGFKPSEPGYIDYILTENIIYRQMEVYSIPSKHGVTTVKLSDGETWHELGRLETGYTVFDISFCEHPVKIRLEWTTDDAASLHEILFEGEPYIQPVEIKNGISGCTFEEPMTKTYNLQGIQIPNGSKGIHITVDRNGKAKKVQQ